MFRPPVVNGEVSNLDVEFGFVCLFGFLLVLFSLVVWGKLFFFPGGLFVWFFLLYVLSVFLILPFPEIVASPFSVALTW